MDTHWIAETKTCRRQYESFVRSTLCKILPWALKEEKHKAVAPNKTWFIPNKPMRPITILCCSKVQRESRMFYWRLVLCFDFHSMCQMVRLSKLQLYSIFIGSVLSISKHTFRGLYQQFVQFSPGFYEITRFYSSCYVLAIFYLTFIT